MDYRLTGDQLLFVEGVREVLEGECTPAHVRAAAEARTFDRGRWDALAEVGVQAAAVPIDHGGLGLTDLDLVGILVEAGRACLPEPLLESIVAARLLADLGGTVADEWLPHIAEGRALVVVALPDVDPYPAHVTSADLVLVGVGDAVHAVAPDDLEVTPQPSLDTTRPTASVRVPDDRSPTWTDAGGAIARAAGRGATAAAAILVGAGHAMIDQAVAYAAQREQFGVAIGTFQAVKHHLATALVDVTFARPLVEAAADAVDRGADDAGDRAAQAKAFAGDAADAAARHALQVHGAIGYTAECDLQLWMKRTWSLAAAWGDTESQWQVVERTLLA